MSRVECNAKLSTLVSDALAPLNFSKLKELDSEIHVFEVRYGMTSDEMLVKFKAEYIDDTAEIAQWLYLLELRELIAD